MQQTEVSLHWKRNGFFLLSSSILLVALSQFQVLLVVAAFGVLGFVLNLLWLFIQYRSSEYVKYWKKEINRLEKESNSNTSIFNPDVKGFEMRLVALALPIPFLLIWTAVIAQSILDLLFNNGVSNLPVDTIIGNLTSSD